LAMSLNSTMHPWTSSLRRFWFYRLLAPRHGALMEENLRRALRISRGDCGAIRLNRIALLVPL
jgi:hypothetical protein